MRTAIEPIDTSFSADKGGSEMKRAREIAMVVMIMGLMISCTGTEEDMNNGALGAGSGSGSGSYGAGKEQEMPDPIPEPSYVPDSSSSTPPPPPEPVRSPYPIPCDKEGGEEHRRLCDELNSRPSDDVVRVHFSVQRKTGDKILGGMIGVFYHGDTPDYYYLLDEGFVEESDSPGEYPNNVENSCGRLDSIFKDIRIADAEGVYTQFSETDQYHNLHCLTGLSGDIAPYCRNNRICAFDGPCYEDNKIGVTENVKLEKYLVCPWKYPRPE